MNHANEWLRKSTADGIKIWLDDWRPMPADFNLWAKTAAEAISAIDAGGVTHISFDHDLGAEAGQREFTGYDVAKHIEEGAANKTIAPMTWAVHSANPSGSQAITMAMRAADRFWGEQDSEVPVKKTSNPKNAWLVKADPNKRVVIMRGLPGSGKSTKAETYGGTKVSADDYFMQDGVYKFDPAKLAEAHAAAKSRFEEALRRGESPVVVDNTNVSEREYRDYVDLAAKYGYTIDFDVVGSGGVSPEELAKRNTHGVPESTIRRMMERWEGEPLYPNASMTAWMRPTKAQLIRHALLALNPQEIPDNPHLALQALRESILAELDAINLYEQFADQITEEDVKKTLLDIAREEKTHVGELEAILKKLDPEFARELEMGKKETEQDA